MQFLDSVLQLQNSCDVQSSVLVATASWLSILSQLVVEHGILLLVQLELIVYCHKYFLFQFVEQHCCVVREGVGEGGRFEGLVIPDFTSE